MAYKIFSHFLTLANFLRKWKSFVIIKSENKFYFHEDDTTVWNDS
jgi:hypothetical protein